MSVLNIMTIVPVVEVTVGAVGAIIGVVSVGSSMVAIVVVSGKKLNKLSLYEILFGLVPGILIGILIGLICIQRKPVAEHNHQHLCLILTLLHCVIKVPLFTNCRSFKCLSRFNRNRENVHLR